MSYSSLQQLRELDISNAEVSEVLKLKQTGISDETCVALVSAAHADKTQFSSAAVVGGLRQAGMAEVSLVQLARLGQLASNAGELEALRLTGVSDAVVVEVARLRAEKKPAPSGASLGQMRNAGISNSTILELLRSGIDDSQAAQIIALRRQHVSEARVHPRNRARHFF